MPLNAVQKQAHLAPQFAGARKPLANYISKIGLDRLYDVQNGPGGANLTRLSTAFHPDVLYSFINGLTAPELQRFSQMNQPTLNSMSTMMPPWVKAMLRTISAPVPALFVTVPPGGPAGMAGVILNANGAIEQTSTQIAFANTLVTELVAPGICTRNLIFSAAGNCVAEINFDNHGGTAVSGHAHVYPVMCIPSTGHHAIGTPHVDMTDYPLTWRQLPGGVNPRRVLGT